MEAGNGGFGSGDDHEVPDPQRRNRRNHRHTPHQIQELEAVFNENPHPDEKQRLQLSRALGLSPRQIKFWFQNRRTQTKTQHERADNTVLRGENDKIRCENIAMKEAMKNVICPSCGGPSIVEDGYLDEQNLIMENTRLREELDRVSGIVSKYLGRPISRLQPVQTIPLSSLDLSVGNFGGQGNVGPSLDLDLLPGSSFVPALPFQITGMSVMEKSQIADIAASSLDELIRLLRTDEPLWMKSTIGGRDALNLECYERIFPRANHSKNQDVWIEASRDSGIVFMNGLALIDMFRDSNKWADMFPTIISKSRTIEVLAPGIKIGSSSLQLMYAELQVLSPVVSSRECYFIRSCQQIEQGLWAVVDVSYDFSPENLIVSHSNFWRLPSGCLIQDMPNGYSKVSWVEHVEVEDKIPTHPLYKNYVQSGMAFGAGRWITTLERMCERNACLIMTNSSTRNLGAVSSSEGRKSMMELAQRMVKKFCSNISASRGHQETSLSGLNNDGVRVTVHKSIDPGQPNGVVLSASTSIWLPASPQIVFNFFGDERARAQWDVLADGDTVEEIAHIANGSHPGNRISVLRGSLSQAFNARQNNMLIFQESCTDSSGSLIVYAPIDLPSINLAMSGDDSSYIPLLPSGFVIFPDGLQNQGGGAGVSTSSSRSRSGGSVLTVAFQILVSSLPSAKLNLESVATVNNLISTTVQQIKAGLNYHSS